MAAYAMFVILLIANTLYLIGIINSIHNYRKED